MNEQLSRKDLINATLLSFKITTYDFEEIQGAAVTLYKFRPQLGIRVSKIRGLKDELAAVLGVSSVRIIAPLADGSVGIEVPNKQKPVLPLSEILCSPEYLTSDMALPLAIGRTVTNSIFMADLADMPHLLVAGATGQGKSVGLNVMLMSLLHKKTPEELKLVLIDPKKVELSVYSKLAGSYLAHPVITEVEEAQNVLTALCNIMDERYDLVSSAGKRNIKEYNSLSIVEPLPYIVVVIDEYGDLVMQAGREMERAICRLAQKARAVGIHLIISTQRPSATVVTGNIKANFPVRIAFRTTTGTDSRVILDQTGAEKLTGRGDMIYFAGAETTRVQCAYTGIDEVLQTVSDIADSYNEYEAKEIIKIEQYTSVQTEDDRIEQYKKAIQGLGYSREDRDKKDYLFAKIVNGIDLKAWREME
jgi:S-DNA-T family DNA segregation ATPase FtsK/SpoIIIE